MAEAFHDDVAECAIIRVMSLPAPRDTTTVLVTGSSSGIGVDLARQLAQRGHNLVLVARREDRLKALADELIAQHGIRADVIAADLGDPAARDAMIASVRGLGLDVVGVCNNAGYALVGENLTQDYERERQMIRLNMEALHHLTFVFASDMVQRGAGAILNVASVAASQPTPLMSTYAATKSFVLSYSEALHTETAPRGVSVTSLCPGPVTTEFQEVAGIGEEGFFAPKIVELTPQEVARQAIDGMEKGRRVVTPGLFVKVTATAGRFTPRKVLLPLLRAGGERQVPGGR